MGKQGDVEIKRTIARGVLNVSKMPVTELLPNFKDIKIKRIWSILNEEAMFAPSLFNTETGKKLETPIARTLENPNLRHGTTVFLEDQVHDWSIHNNVFSFYSRIADKGEKMDLLIEYEEKD